MQADILDRFETLSVRYGELRRDFSPPLPATVAADWLGLFNSLPEMSLQARWMKSPGSYSNLFELIVQYLVYRTLTNPPPAAKIDSPIEPGNVCVRFVKSPHFILENIPADPYFYIVVSEPAYSLPLHVGMALALLAVRQTPSTSENPVTTDMLGGRSAAAAIIGDLNGAQPVLNSLWTSAMDAAVGARQDAPTEWHVALDEENQQQFANTALALMRWGGESPFEFGVAYATAFFPLMFILYGVMHELGHLWFQHSAGLREHREELAADLAALLAVEQKFPSHSCRVPVAVGAASVFYAVAKYLSFLQAKKRFMQGASDDTQFYRSGEGFPDAGESGHWEHKLIQSRATGAGAFAASVCAPYLLGARDDISLFWSLHGEIEFVTGYALDVHGSMPQQFIEHSRVAARARYQSTLRERIAASEQLRTKFEQQRG